ncbi:hypothetical protein ACGFZK_35575 [Streptomyces sp. NPDC048257]
MARAVDLMEKGYNRARHSKGGGARAETLEVEFTDIDYIDVSF